MITKVMIIFAVGVFLIGFVPTLIKRIVKYRKIKAIDKLYEKQLKQQNRKI
jgi:hypothetical protein